MTREEAYEEIDKTLDHKNFYILSNGYGAVTLTQNRKKAINTFLDKVEEKFENFEKYDDEYDNKYDEVQTLEDVLQTHTLEDYDEPLEEVHLSAVDPE